MSDKPVKIAVPDMRVPCDECLNDSNYTFSNGDFIATYCRHHSAGALLDTRPEAPLHRVWRIMSPISEEVFAAFVNGTAAGAAAKSAAIKNNGMTWN